ncbi:MAG: serine/threonine-protein kinase [Myxococcota bacterium]
MTDPNASRPVPRLGDRFLVVNTLGDGGTATVYLAYDTQSHTWVALKALHKKYIDDEEMQRRFGFEARALQILTHPNVPRLVHYAPDSRPPFMAMELARCGSAMDWVRKHGAMPAQMACQVIVQVCDAVGDAHEKGMIHRDIKPHNVLLDDTGVSKLTDFGIARLDDATSLTATGSQIGTFSFMAPEQRSDTKTVDQRADIYSLGSSFYTMLTSRTSAELFTKRSPLRIGPT